MTASATCAFDQISFRSPVTDTYDYDAFGNQVHSTGSTPNEMLYRGEQFDSDLGLYYLRARYYNPITGRFMSRDPQDGAVMTPATLHKYLYANGDPIDLADPTGRDADAGALRRPAGGALGEYTGLIIFVSLQVVPQVRTAESALLCLLASDATNFTANVTNALFYGNSGDIEKTGDCTWGVNHDCTLYEEAIQTALELVKGRYDEMLIDIHKLYPLYCKDQAATTEWGNWLGHQQRYLDKEQLDLQNAIEAADRHDCPVSPEARIWAYKPPPICPAGRIPKP